ncbi:MAG: DUF2288 domain-containing protein [Arenicellales bacterium]
MSNINTETDPEIEKAKLNLETAQAAWTDLQTLFAQGSVIWADTSLDLIEVAQGIAQDDSAQVTVWMDANLLAQVSDDQAKKWLAEDAFLWSVVVRPLVLVQEIKV